MTSQQEICAFCRASTLVSPANGVIVTYKSGGKTDISVSLHKSCAAAWSKQFAQSIATQISRVPGP